MNAYRIDFVANTITITAAFAKAMIRMTPTIADIKQMPFFRRFPDSPFANIFLSPICCDGIAERPISTAK